jgi:hypothetical protein
VMRGAALDVGGGKIYRPSANNGRSLSTALRVGGFITKPCPSTPIQNRARSPNVGRTMLMAFWSNCSEQAEVSPCEELCHFYSQSPEVEVGRIERNSR